MTERSCRHFVEGIAAMTKAADRGLTEEDVTEQEHRQYLFHFHDSVIEQARKALAEINEHDDP